MSTSEYPATHTGSVAKRSDTSETVADAVTGQDAPMEEKHPSAPAALVFASYPVMLAIGVVAMIVIYWMLS